MTAERVALLLGEFAEGLEATSAGGETAVRFTRDVGDEALDRALRALQEAGARVVSCETERGTLLDVLELYESEGEERG